MPPTIVFVPGLWEGPDPFERVSKLLTESGFKVEVAHLASTGTVSPGNPKLQDDVAAVQSQISKFIGTSAVILLVLHSAGGFIGSNAIEGLTAKARQAQHLDGGVVKIVFLTAGILPEGFEHTTPPFVNEADGCWTIARPEVAFFNDLPPAETEKWLKALQTQPSDWNGKITFAGWKDVPSIYLVCKKDNILPEALQLQFAQIAGSKIEECDAGHMVILSQPEKVAEVIKAAVGSI